jgi:transmembrane 9 superfamily protein 2/4
MSAFKIVLIAAVVQVALSAQFYLPGVSPHTYQPYEAVDLLVTKLTSTKTQMPYDYYSLPYCKPKALGLQKENLGQVVSGDRIENSVYKVCMYIYIYICFMCIYICIYVKSWDRS